MSYSRPVSPDVIRLDGPTQMRGVTPALIGYLTNPPDPVLGGAIVPVCWPAG
jgi:hypothetical protein